MRCFRKELSVKSGPSAAAAPAPANQKQNHSGANRKVNIVVCSWCESSAPEKIPARHQIPREDTIYVYSDKRDMHIYYVDSCAT